MSTKLRLVKPLIETKPFTIKERIEACRNAIKMKKYQAQKAVNEGRLVELSNCLLDLDALERCLDIELASALKSMK